MGKQNVRRRTDKQAERWRRKYIRQRELNEQIREAAGDILCSRNFKSTREYIQHGNMTVSGHCMNVAKYSLAFSDKLHIPCNRKELIRGALLHDYFLYDWHDPEHVGIQNLHGFYHPGIALKNASKEYSLTEREKDIIKKHMWPLTIVPPACREAWIVSAADKWCSLMETVHIHKGHGAFVSQEEMSGGKRASAGKEVSGGKGASAEKEMSGSKRASAEKEMSGGKRASAGKEVSGGGGASAGKEVSGGKKASAPDKIEVLDKDKADIKSEESVG